MTEDYPLLDKKIVEDVGNLIRHQYDFSNGYTVVAERDKRKKPEKSYSGLWTMALYHKGDMLLTRDFPGPTAYFNDPSMDELLVRVARYSQ